MLRIMAKRYIKVIYLYVILRSERVNTWEFWYLLGQELKVMILALKNISYLKSRAWFWRSLNSYYQQQRL